MAVEFIPYIKKQLKNTLFNETIFIEQEKNKRKLTNALSFIYGLDNAFEKASNETGFYEKPTYDGSTLEDWANNIMRRIYELDTVFCYENNLVVILNKEGAVRFTLCDGSQVIRQLKYGSNVITDCIQKDTIKPFSDRKKYPVAANIAEIKYGIECGTTTTTTTSQGDSYECTPKFGCIRSQMGRYKTLEECQKECARAAL